MNERKFDMNRDGLGLLLFALGLFPAVLIVKALLSTAPVESISGSGPIALTWIRALGGMPSLLFTSGFMLLGARLFLFGKRDSLVRDALGIAGVSLALSVFLGAFSPTAGGNIGYATGGLVSSMAHVAVGALFGLVALALSIWVPWLREERAPRIATVPEDGAGAVLDEESDTGVSAEEAAALIPEDFNRAIDEGRKQLAVKPVRSAPPPSPYPEDVRLKGQIPPGARPLNAEPDVRTEPESAPQPSSVYRWTAPRTDVPGDGAGEDLASVPDPEVVFGARPLADEPTWIDAPEELGSAAAERVERVADPVELEEIEAELELSEPTEERAVGVDASGSASADPLGALPRPSWEQSSLFTEADEPVDAYGTPLTLVEALRREDDAGVPSDSEATAPATGDPLQVIPTETDFAPVLEVGSEDELEIEEVAVRPVSSGRVPSVEETDEEADDEDFADDEFLGEGSVVADEEVEVFEDEDEDADEDEDEVAESEEEELLAEDGESEEADELEVAATAPVAAERAIASAPLRDNEAEHEPRAPAAAVAPLLVAPAAVAPLAVAQKGGAQTTGAQATEAEAAADTDSKGSARASAELTANAPGRRGVAPAAPAVPLDGPLVELMEGRSRARHDGSNPRADAPSGTEVTPSKTAGRAPLAKPAGPAAVTGERDVILKPRAVSADKAIKSQAALPERAELLREAGCLFVDRGRVAVSMLQRQYGMDFDQACEVLDELQNLGLIGPYLGGQRRDILLTREQWLEKVGSA